MDKRISLLRELDQINLCKHEHVRVDAEGNEEIKAVLFEKDCPDCKRYREIGKQIEEITQNNRRKRGISLRPISALGDKLVKPDMNHQKYIAIAKSNGISQQTYYARVKKGMTQEDASTIKARTYSKTGTVPHTWTDEQDAAVRKYVKVMSRKDMQATLNKEFNLDLTFNQVANYLRNNKITAGHRKKRSV